MNIRHFKASDLPHLNRWLKRNSHQQQSLSALPHTGYIIPGVACAFVRGVEGGTAILDSVATNSLVSAELRNKALDALFVHCLKLPVDGWVGFTLDANTQMRAERHGFTVSNYTLLTRKG